MVIRPPFLRSVTTKKPAVRIALVHTRRVGGYGDVV